MAAPIYSNDLVTIATGDLNFDAGTWNESSDSGFDTAGAMVDDTNLQYTKNSLNTGEADDSCTSAQYTKLGTGSGTTGPGTIMYQHTAAFTVPTDGAVLIHDLWAAPDALNPYAGTFGVAEAGVSVLIGDDFGNFDVHYASGSDREPAPEGGWTTYCVDPTVTPDGTIGTVTVTQCAGVAIAATVQARGNPHAVQAVRYGRCEQIYTAGDVATPANFEGYAVIDNAPADRFNLLKYQGKGYISRGLQTFGTAATAVFFEDTDKSIIIADDPKVGTNFNAGVVNNSGSVLNWNNISISNTSAVSKYTFNVNDGAETNKNGGTFEDLGVFNYGVNSTNDGVTYRRQELISQLGATFIGCTFDKPVGSAGLLADNLNLITKGVFAKGTGTSHAVELTSIGGGSMTWDNVTTGYDIGATGSPVTPTSTGNEDLYVNVANGTLTINVATGATTPSIRSAGAIINVVAGLSTITFITLPSVTGYEYRIYKVTAVGSLSGSVEVQGLEVTTLDSYSYSYTHNLGDVYAIQFLPHALDYVEDVIYFESSANDQTKNFNLKVDINN